METVDNGDIQPSWACPHIRGLDIWWAVNEPPLAPVLQMTTKAGYPPQHALICLTNQKIYVFCPACYAMRWK